MAPSNVFEPTGHTCARRSKALRANLWHLCTSCVKGVSLVAENIGFTRRGELCFRSAEEWYSEADKGGVDNYSNV